MAMVFLLNYLSKKADDPIGLYLFPLKFCSKQQKNGHKI